MAIILNLTWVRGVFIPTSDQDKELCLRLKTGQVISSEWTRKRNYQLHKKFFALIDTGFESWEPNPIDGMDIEKNFEVFRKKVIIRAGYYIQVFDLDGGFTLEAKSISFAKMEQDDFDKLYSACINVILKDILINHTRADFENQINQILSFT